MSLLSQLEAVWKPEVWTIGHQEQLDVPIEQKEATHKQIVALRGHKVSTHEQLRFLQEQWGVMGKQRDSEYRMIAVLREQRCHLWEGHYWTEADKIC